MANESKWYSFRRRSNNSSCDPYDSLATRQNSPNNMDHLLLDGFSSVWTNGTTVLLSQMPQAAPTSAPLLQPSTSLLLTMSNTIQSAPIKNSSMVKQENLKNENEVRDSIIAGSIAGMTSIVLFHPFDVIRTKMQSTTKLKAIETTTAASKQIGATILSASAPKNGISSSSGPIAVFSHTIKNGGIRAFYTGFSFPLAAQAAYKSTVFTVNRMSQNAVVDFKTRELWKTGTFTPYQLKPVDHFVCGFVSGAVNALVFVSPVEYVRNQLIAQHTNIAQGTNLKNAVMNGPVDVIRTTLKSKGILGLWRGAGVTFVRDSFGCGAFFVLFELGKKKLPSVTGIDPESRLNTIGSGMMAGLGYWMASLPLDSLKTLVQTGQATSAWSTVSFLVNRDGIFGAYSQLYRGWQLAFGRGAPSAAVTLTTYSAVYHFCDTRLA
jgi:hypothetical protein